MTPYPLRSNGKWLRVRYGAIMTPYQMICGSPFKMVVNLDFWHLWVFFYWFSKSFEDGKILPKKWKSDCFQILFWKIKLYQLCHFPFCSNWSLSLFNFHESFSITGDTIRNGLDDSGFFVDERPSVPPQDQREGPLERLTRVCGRALLCPERTCAAVKSHTEKEKMVKNILERPKHAAFLASFYNDEGLADHKRGAHRKENPAEEESVNFFFCTKGRLSVPNSMNFRKTSEWGGGHFRSKNFVAFFLVILGG